MLNNKFYYKLKHIDMCWVTSQFTVYLFLYKPYLGILIIKRRTSTLTNTLQPANSTSDVFGRFDIIPSPMKDYL